MAITKTELYFDSPAKLALLADAAGLALDPSGVGVVAAAAGVTGSGHTTLPVTANSGTMSRTSILWRYNGDTANTFEAGTYPAGTANDSATGCRATYRGGRSARDGGSFPIDYSGNPVAGTLQFTSFADDGANVTITTGPVVRIGIGGSNYQTAEAENTVVTPATVSGTDPFDAQARVGLTSSSVTTAVVGILSSVGGWGFPADPRLAIPWGFGPVINGDTTVRVRHPGMAGCPLIIVGHPNASDEATGQRMIDPDMGVAIAHLLSQGYAVVYGRGDPSSYTGAAACPWGGPGISHYRAMYDWYVANVEQPPHTFWLGMSMGGVDGLAFHRANPGILTAFAGICPVTNLQYANDSEGFASVIATGLAGQTIAATDPNQHPADYKALPIKIWYGDADTTLHPAEHCLLFASNVNAAGGNVSTVAIAGGQHINVAAEWDGPGLAAFFTSAMPSLTLSSPTPPVVNVPTPISITLTGGGTFGPNASLTATIPGGSVSFTNVNLPPTGNVGSAVVTVSAAGTMTVSAGGASGTVGVGAATMTASRPTIPSGTQSLITITGAGLTGNFTFGGTAGASMVLARPPYQPSPGLRAWDYYANGNGTGTVTIADAAGPSATVAQVAAQPSPPQVTPASGSAVVTWAASAGASGYRVYLNGTAAANVSSGSPLTTTLTGLANGTAYSVGLSALDAAGDESAVAGPVTVTPAIASLAAGGGFNPTPNDGADQPSYGRTFSAEGAGVVKVTLVGQSSPILVPVAPGVAYPIAVARLWANGTTAAGPYLVLP